MVQALFSFLAGCSCYAVAHVAQSQVGVSLWRLPTASNLWFLLLLVHHIDGVVS